MQSLLLLQSLEQILGKSQKKSKTNYAFYCPFCNHKKRKLEIDLDTNEKGENPYACWVCVDQNGTKGKTIYSLLNKLKLSKEQSEEILKYLPKYHKKTYHPVTVTSLQLPEEYVPLTQYSSSFLYTKALNYVLDRGLTKYDIIKYQIGYCTSGEYENSIIVPSYNKNLQLNFFETRSFFGTHLGYKKPETSKNVIFFEHLINWNYPIILCEGVFDAMTIKRNCIPLLGKTINTCLLKTIIENKVKTIYLVLDVDAISSTVKYCQLFFNMGIDVYLTQLQDNNPNRLGLTQTVQIDLKKLNKDPNKLGFIRTWEKINQSTKIDYKSLVQNKLNVLS